MECPGTEHGISNRPAGLMTEIGRKESPKLTTTIDFDDCICATDSKSNTGGNIRRAERDSNKSTGKANRQSY